MPFHRGCSLSAVGVALYGARLKLPASLTSRHPHTPKDFGLAYEEVSFQSYDHLKLTGWFLPARVASDVTLIILHGLGSNAGDMLLNVLCSGKSTAGGIFFYFNFRGHGDSDGHSDVAWAARAQRF